LRVIYGKALSDLTPNKLDLSFLAPYDHAKFEFHQLLFKIATAGAMTDRHTHTLTQTPAIL